MKPVPHGEPYAGKLHVRFDEGYPPKNGEARFEGSRRPSGRSPRGVPLYLHPSIFSLENVVFRQRRPLENVVLSIVNSLENVVHFTLDT